MSYSAIVTRVETRSHPNADRLQLGTCCGNQVVVGLDTASGTLGVFFPTDGQLSPEMCAANDLIRRRDPMTGEMAGGFFDENRRVRAQTFRGTKSDGYWTPLSSLAWTGANLSKLREGDTLTELNGKPICNKYVTAATMRAIRAIRAGAQPIRKSYERFFPQHVETDQFRFVAGAIPAGAIVYISEKLHGTSGRYGHVPDDVHLPRWKALVNRIAPVFPARTWRYLNGSRRVVFDGGGNGGYYGSNEFRIAAVEGLSLRKGETLYFELVGDVADGQPIMAPQDTRTLKDKEIRSRYGDTMRYSYGCSSGTLRLFVYRITVINEDGHVVELPWPQVTRRCAELGIRHVPVLDGPFIHDGDPAALAARVNALVDGPSTLDTRHIREGVCLRVEHETGGRFIKHKSWTFGVLEGYLKEAPEYVDTEEAA